MPTRPDLDYGGEFSAPEEWLSKDDPKRIAWERARAEINKRIDFEDARKAVQDLPPEDRAKISDGYHTFAELYEHRIELYITLCRVLRIKYPIWRSRLHSDGTGFEGWFVLGLDTMRGKQITYHLPDSRWDDCGFAMTLPQAPPFDGHTSADVLERLRKL